MKKIFKIIIVCLAIVLVLYISESLYISTKVHSLVEESYNTYGLMNTKSNMVSTDIYNKMCYRITQEHLDSYPISRSNVTEYNKLNFPSTLHWFFGGKVYYQYSYEARDKNNESLLEGSWDIGVTVDYKLLNWKFEITDYYEAP